MKRSHIEYLMKQINICRSRSLVYQG